MNLLKCLFARKATSWLGASNFLAWKKRIDLNLTENEVMEHVKGPITKPPKEDAQALARYMKGEVRAQKILIESIKYSLIPYVSKLETSKEIYDKLVELFSVVFCKHYRWSNLIKTRTLQAKNIKEEGIGSYFMRIFKNRDQLQDLGEIMSKKILP